MRAYIRHPSEFPIELGTSEQNEVEERMSDVSVGGLSCHSRDELSQGQKVTIRPLAGTQCRIECVEPLGGTNHFLLSKQRVRAQQR